ncbi:MAG: putative capsid protein [Aguamentivirus racskinis]|uniref:Putative capsid protein n=1 Tax=Circoviridae sp. TaxID=1954248 RepID=A0A3G2YT12_9VIRU|nr:MAG: putative capsid protein [Circoviridae sp.]
MAGKKWSRTGRRLGGVAAAVGSTYAVGKYVQSKLHHYKKRSSKVTSKTGNKHNFKGTGSKTTTRQKKKSEVKMDDAGLTHSFVRTRFKGRHVQRGWKVLQTSQYLDVRSERFGWAIGTQGAFLADTTGETDVIQKIYGLFGSSGLGLDSARMELVDIKSTLTIANRSEWSMMKMTIYDCVYRKDFNDVAVAGSTPTDAWNAGLALIPGSMLTTSYGATPFMSPMFCANYNVVKVSVVYVRQGGTHIHHVKRRINHVFNNEEFDTLGAASYVRRYLTMTSMVVCQGMPINDSTVTTNVSTGAGAIDVLHERKYNVRMFQVSTKFAKNAIVLPTITTEKDMNELVGGSVVYADA